MKGANRPPTGLPGWYSDPWQPGRGQRYWDGSNWTPMTAPIGPTMPQHAAAGMPPRAAAGMPPRMAVPSPRPRRFGKIFGLSTAAFVLAVAVVLYAILQGQEIKKVSPSGDIEFYSSGGGTEFSSDEIKQRQNSMDSRLSDLEQRARQSAEAEPEPVADLVDLSGTWSGANGLSYEIEQFDNQAVIQEVSLFGITATGFGEVDGTRVTFSYQAIDNSTGIADLELVDEHTLEGTFQNHTFGTSVPAVLTR